MTLSENKYYYSAKSKAELIEEIMRLNKEVRSKNEEIAILKKRILLYKSLK
jgi:hypothetical protein